MSNETLMTQVALGDHDAFAEVYRRCSPPMLRSISLRLKNHAMAEEVVQDVFAEVWLRASTFSEERGKLHSWLATIAHRRAVDRIRASQASRDRDIRAGFRDLEVESEDQFERLDIVADFTRVLLALSHLSALQEQAVRLVYLEATPLTEAALALGVPVGTLKTRVRDGLLRLRAELETPASYVRRRVAV